VYGGRHVDGVSTLDLDDVWLFVYRTSSWINLTRSPLNKLVIVPPDGTSIFTVNNDDENTADASLAYVPVGAVNGSLVIGFYVVSPCYSFTTEESCLDSHGLACSWCRNTTTNLSYCVPQQILSSRHDGYEELQCSSQLGTFKALSRQMDTGDVDCSTFTDCESCSSAVSPSSRTQRPQCHWCWSSCGFTLSGSCQPITDNSLTCPHERESCRRVGCSMCEADTCHQCNQVRENCIWRPYSHFQQGCSWAGISLDSDVVQVPSHCPSVRCEDINSCSTCRSYVDCRWSADLGDRCISSTAIHLLCSRGECGSLSYLNGPACPAHTCEDITYCDQCLKLSPDCGWFGMDDGSGRGFCKKGSFVVSFV